jgi:CheY-like chemotaxis protein
MKILLVDDANVNRYILKRYIQRVRMSPPPQISECSNGTQAVSLASNFDVIFMDIKMPGIDGIEATRLIRLTNKKVIIYGITGQIEKQVVRTALATGMNKCIGKPLMASDISALFDQDY